MGYRELFADAVRYWERRRIAYNAVLAILVVVCWGGDIVSGGPRDWFAAALVLTILAGLANVLYCLAYPIDLSVQLTPLRGHWRRLRWLLFACGLALASTLAVWVMLGPGMA